jgi:hypothetical protein
MELPIVLAIDTTEHWRQSKTALGVSELAIEITTEADGTHKKLLLCGDNQMVGPNVERLRVDKSYISGLPQELQDLLNRITAETDRAKQAEQTLQNNIAGETNRAQEAEAQLQNNINAEKNRAQQAETALGNTIIAEQNRAQAEEARIERESKARDDTEIARAQTQEAWLRERVTQTQQDYQAADAAHAARHGKDGVHGATSAPLPGEIITRDADGRAQVAEPINAADIARKSTVDGAAQQAADDLAAHAALNNWRAHGATIIPTPNRLPTYDANKKLHTGAPAVAPGEVVEYLQWASHADMLSEMALLIDPVFATPEGELLCGPQGEVFLADYMGTAAQDSEASQVNITRGETRLSGNNTNTYTIADVPQDALYFECTFNGLLQNASDFSFDRETGILKTYFGSIPSQTDEITFIYYRSVL